MQQRSKHYFSSNNYKNSGNGCYETEQAKKALHNTISIWMQTLPDLNLCDCLCTQYQHHILEIV